jgi:3'-phosphoadenosine 5'-phosphosulfate sulfotransferase (PAPS reductase)/FAD synthetase
MDNDNNGNIIVCVSGGLSSFFCADWALKKYPKDKIILYFNDTKWEHPDLYRFLSDIQNYLNHPIIFDTDGRDPEQLFYDHHALANNRMPFCSRALKAERLQQFYKDGDTLIFGIGLTESHRANRLIGRYQVCSVKLDKYRKLEFPLISQNISSKIINNFMKTTGIRIPLLYKLGFSHNNCSGGCVRQGISQWRLLLRKLPEVYRERERVETEFNNVFGTEYSFMKHLSLKELREQPEQLYFSDDNNDQLGECIGICDLMN